MRVPDITVRRARTAVCRALRTRPPQVRATLPFDPDDEVDVGHWVADHPAVRSTRTPAWIAKRIELDARGLARVPRHLSTCQSDLSDQEQQQYLTATTGSQRASEMDQAELAEELASCSARACRNVADNGHNQCTTRSSIAVLGCLARVYYAVRSYLFVGAVEAFVETLLGHRDFLELPLPEVVRGNFKRLLRGLGDTGNFRSDFAEAGMACPGHDQWNAFVAELARQYGLKQADGVIKFAQHDLRKTA